LATPELISAWDGWLEHAPFDKILVTAAADTAPATLLDQLKPGGRLVMPLGPEEMQRLTIINKDGDGQTRVQSLLPVRFGRLESVI
jgi:protein-L-isoaspartate(D-aspartate) O-methyltransferase